nr:IMP cyclohydrolase [Oscillospiraceae bacterium]
TFEDDAPNFTPRISGIVHLEDNGMNYAMSILKSANGNDKSTRRFTFAYSDPISGEGSFIHTYAGDEENGRLPSFVGEPKEVVIPDMSLDEFTDFVWNNLNADNKVSLFTRYIDLETGKFESRIVNKNK